MGLDAVELVLWAEHEFNIQISDDDAEYVRTVGDFVALIRRLSVVKQGMNLVSEEAVFRKVRDRLMTEYRVGQHLITSEAEIVRDLGLD